MNKDPKSPKPLVLDLEVDEDCFWILRAASRSRAEVREGMWRKMALGDLQGLLGSKSGDFLRRSGVVVVSGKENRHVFLQRFTGKFEL